MTKKITKTQLRQMIKEALLKEQSSSSEGVLQHLAIKLKQVESEVRKAQYNVSENTDPEGAAEYEESVRRIKKAVAYMQSLVNELD